MHPNRPSRLFLPLLVSGALLFETACDAAPYITGCDVNASAGGKAFTDKRLDGGGFGSGIHALVTVNGQTLPTGGWDLPKTDKNLKALDLTFKATGSRGTCSKMTHELGIVTGRFVLATANGQAIFPGKAYSSTYEHDLEKNKVTLRAPAEYANNKYKIFSVTGDDNGTTLTFLEGIPYIATYELVFRR